MNDPCTYQEYEVALRGARAEIARLNAKIDRINRSLPEFHQLCPECGRMFDALRQGKLRMAEHFCSLDCADKAYPQL
jgi:hypothetical protein